MIKNLIFILFFLALGCGETKIVEIDQEISQDVPGPPPDVEEENNEPIEEAGQEEVVEEAGVQQAPPPPVQEEVIEQEPDDFVEPIEEAGVEEIIDEPTPEPLESCMICHNSANEQNYDGSGISNPHPFPPADNIKCTTCHGGDGSSGGKNASHVPPPPKIGDRQYQIINPEAFFNRITLSGIDKLEPNSYDDPYTPGRSWSNIDYLQFINPGDLRVVKEGRSCGNAGCHLGEHVDWVKKSIIGTTTGIFSGAKYNIGSENRIPVNRIQEEGEALADAAPRAVENFGYNESSRNIGETDRLIEVPEIGQYNGPMRQNPGWDANALANDFDISDPTKFNRVRTGSNLDRLYTEQISITCGNCHLGSAGDNNRYGDFRSSGCTSCHMEYSFDGRSRSTDPNVNRLEPANPDQIAPGERAHISDHVIRNVYKEVNGTLVRGISDKVCAGCHQGSNRTVMQYWGIRLDQNADLTNEFQYPDNPDTFVNTANDTRLFNPAVNNQTFNGRNNTQYILAEDYDGDQLDDTPPDVHYEAGLGCIDCHGSRDLHGGTRGDTTSGKIQSRQDQSTFITCESCHGTIDELAPTIECTSIDEITGPCAIDKLGNPLNHVIKDPQGNLWLRSKVTGDTHYVPQTKDLVTNNNKVNPLTGQLIYNQKAAYGMGRVNGTLGSGPQQQNYQVRDGFSHTDDMDCTSCHASWTNSCIGCHLKTQYDDNPNNFFFSNITGERILLKEANADFVYQSPILTYLGINSKGYITQIDPAEKMFYRYEDLNGNESQVFAFSNRQGEGNNPGIGGRNDFPALAMNQMTAHSIRGKIKNQNEGMRYCVACHITQNGIDTYGAEYQEFWDLYQNNDFAQLFDNGYFDLMREHIGKNTNNHLDSPFFIHMTTGLGTLLFLFDQDGCPVNPFDNNPNRENCNGNAPADIFDLNNVVYDLDKIVQIDGQTNAGSIHPRIDDRLLRRDGSNREMSGPLNRRLIEKLADPNLSIVLDSWLDSNGDAQGNANDFLQ